MTGLNKDQARIMRRFAKSRGLPWVFSMHQLVRAIQDAKPDDSFLLIDENQLAWSFHKKDFGGARLYGRIENEAGRLLGKMKASTGVMV